MQHGNERLRIVYSAFIVSFCVEITPEQTAIISL